MVNVKQPLVEGLAPAYLEKAPVTGIYRLDLVCAFGGQKKYGEVRMPGCTRDPVSYTHLTLPTICSV